MSKVVSRRRNAMSRMRFRYSAGTLRNAVNVGRYVGQSIKRAYKNWRVGKKKPKGRKIIASKMISSGTSGISTSGYSRKGRTPYNMRSVFARGQLRNAFAINPQRLTWSAGYQGITNWAFLDSARMERLWSTISEAGNPLSTMYVRSASLKVYFTNQSNSNCMLTIYNVIQRHDSYASQDDVTALSAWNSGVAQQPYIGGSYTARTSATVGATPFQSLDFTKKYHVVKVTNVYLELGKSHIHNVYLGKPFSMSGRVFDTSGATPSSFKGITHTLLVVAKGMPIGDLTDPSLVAMGAGAIDMVAEETITFSYPPQSLKDYINYDTQGAITNENLMNEQSGVAAQFSAA